MKKIIKGKIYDTEVAECVASYSFSGGNDFRYISEKLYRTFKGAFFLYGEGGPMTKYAVDCGNNSRCGGREIAPMNTTEAMHWLEQHDFPEVIEKYFSDKIEEA